MVDTAREEKNSGKPRGVLGDHSPPPPPTPPQKPEELLGDNPEGNAKILTE